MTNLEKIDCAVTTTLELHPDYQEIMADILMKKILEEDPLTTAKFFSRANDARAHMMEVSNLDLLSEIVKNAYKVSYLLKQKGMSTKVKEQDLNGSKDDVLFGSTACNWIREQLEKHPNTDIDDLLELHPEILPLLVSVFNETRFHEDSVIKKQELDNSELLEKLGTMLERIDNNIGVYKEA